MSCKSASYGELYFGTSGGNANLLAGDGLGVIRIYPNDSFRKASGGCAGGWRGVAALLLILIAEVLSVFLPIPAPADAAINDRKSGEAE